MKKIKIKNNNSANNNGNFWYFSYKTFKWNKNPLIFYLTFQKQIYIVTQEVRVFFTKKKKVLKKYGILSYFFDIKIKELKYHKEFFLILRITDFLIQWIRDEVDLVIRWINVGIICGNTSNSFVFFFPFIVLFSYRLFVEKIIFSHPILGWDAEINFYRFSSFSLLLLLFIFLLSQLLRPLLPLYLLFFFF